MDARTIFRVPDLPPLSANVEVRTFSSARRELAIDWRGRKTHSLASQSGGAPIFRVDSRARIRFL